MLDPATEHECGCVWGVTPTPGGNRGFILMRCSPSCPLAVAIERIGKEHGRPAILATDADDMRQALARSGL